MSNTVSRRVVLLSTLIATGIAAVPALAASATKKGTIAAASVTPTGAADKAVRPVIEDLIIVEQIDMTPVNLASQIMKSDAYMKDGKKIGDVSDIILDGSNTAIAIAVGIGGFLGIDETYIAIPIAKVSYQYDGSKLKVVADISNDELKQVTRAKG